MERQSSKALDSETRTMETDANTLRWRRSLMSLCVVGFIVWLFHIVMLYTWMTSPGFYPANTEVPFHDVVNAVRPGSFAAKAGMKVGDVVDLRTVSAADRWAFRWRSLLSGRPYTYVVHRGAIRQRVTVRAEHGDSLDLKWWGFYLGALGALIFAAIIAWRRPWLVEARMLCLLLITTVLEVSFRPLNWQTPSPTINFATTMVWALLSEFGVGLLVGYTLLFGRPISAVRKALAAYALLILSFDLLYNWAALAGTWTGAFDLYGGPIGTSALSYWEGLAWITLAPLTIATAVAASRGRERSLLVWTTALPFLSYLTGAVGYIPGIASDFLSFHTVQLDIQNVAEFLTPFAIGYALLKRRLLDIGFVLNQAAIFSGVSIIVVGLFMLGEWMLGAWFSQLSHTTNFAISAALAVGLGFSVRAIHARVEHVLDLVFFRKRHNDEAAIRSFAEEASDATDAATLVRRTKETLETYADAAFVKLAMADGKGRYGDVSESDAAIAALQERHKALDLHTLSTQLQGDFAYPMIARGRLVGALVLGPKRSGDSYAPDESRAIMQLAREVGGALHILTLATVLQEHHLPA